jgi:preprotein translocase subunit SecG
MYLFIAALHVTLCLFLIAVILLQPGKGADPGAAFGGGMTTTVFGPRGPANLLTRATTVVAVMFFLTSVGLALYSNKQVMAGGGSVDDEIRRLQMEELEKKGKVDGPVELPTADESTVEQPKRPIR